MPSLAILGCGSSRGSEESSAALAVADVTVAKVERRPIAASLTVSGNLAALPNRDAKVSALVPGRIARVFVVEGDPVNEGQPLAELDTILLHEQVRQAEGAAAQAQANLDNARIALQRESGLLDRGISSRKDVEDARTQVAVYSAALNQAEAGLAAAKAGMSRAVVRAPFAGMVVKRFVSVGEQVDGSAAQPVAEIADLRTLELLGAVPASRLPGIEVGERFSFVTNAVSEARFPARVVSILPAVDPATNNGTVRIRIENPKRLLKLGEFISLELPLRHSAPTLVVPRQAIYPDESGAPRVYKAVGDQATAISVTTGVESEDEVEVLSGVKEGDTVVVNGGYGLPDKATIHIRQ